MAENKKDTAASTSEAAEKIQPATTFDIRKIYLRDASVESPRSPGIFLSSSDSPEISIDASIKAQKLDQEDYYDVCLGLTVTSKVQEETAFLVEVHQAGVFHIVGIPREDMPLALEIACPNVLLPFAREAISDLVGKAGFPQLLLSPINFEALYQQKKQQQVDANENQADDNSAPNGEQTH
jgi:preprotein translocase subunit SecB